VLDHGGPASAAAFAASRPTPCEEHAMFKECGQAENVAISRFMIIETPWTHLFGPMVGEKQNSRAPARSASASQIYKKHHVPSEQQASGRGPEPRMAREVHLHPWRELAARQGPHAAV